MSFYEDMGIRRDAAAEEIRDRYRVLVRLVHPDQYADPALKSAAEGQLRRFNEMGAVLTDPIRRRDYDSKLLFEHSELAGTVQSRLPPHRERRLPWGSIAWGAAAVACAGAIVWVGDYEAAVVPPVTEVRPAETRVARAPAATSNEDWKTRARVAGAERDSALRELARLRAEHLPFKVAPFTSEIPKPAALPESAAIAPPPAASPPKETAQSLRSFSGVWFYAHRGRPDSTLYAPEFIETQITESNGQVRGRYRSRYRVTDRAISPSVNFNFAGQAEGTSAQLPFVRDDGGRGEVRLRLLSERELEFAWTAKAGNSPSLNSGTAVLIRSQ